MYLFLNYIYNTGIGRSLLIIGLEVFSAKHLQCDNITLSIAMIYFQQNAAKTKVLIKTSSSLHGLRTVR